MTGQELTLKELAKELEQLDDDKKRVRTEARIQNRKENPSAWYRVTHNYNGTKSYGMCFLVFYILAIIGILSVAFIINDGVFSAVGDSNHPLEINRNYDCSYCEWSGNISQMETHDGMNHVYYYCPECGHVIGRIPIGERQG